MFAFRHNLWAFVESNFRQGQWRHQGGGAWGKMPPSRRLCPPLPPPPVRRIKWPKSAIFGKCLDFCPLRIAFCPLDAPHKKISGAATGQGISWQRFVAGLWGASLWVIAKGCLALNLIGFKPISNVENSVEFHVSMFEWLRMITKSNLRFAGKTDNLLWGYDVGAL